LIDLLTNSLDDNLAQSEISLLGFELSSKDIEIRLFIHPFSANSKAKIGRSNNDRSHAYRPLAMPFN